MFENNEETKKREGESSSLFSHLLSYLVGGVGPGCNADPELLVERKEVLGDELGELLLCFVLFVVVEVG